jgi:DNA-binding IclR family transcriptional regulator
VRYLQGREARSVNEIARGIGISHSTAHYLVKGMLEEELIYIQDIRGRPVKYYIPMGKQA